MGLSDAPNRTPPGVAAKADWTLWDLFVAVTLAALTLAVFWRVGKHEFITFDDPQYLTENLRVQGGITWDNVVWAFRTTAASNWHPLTWLSHMLDCQIFGMNAGVHHSVNLFFHLLNALLLFGVFKMMTGARWRSAVVAGLFAFHPLHVESVAWVSERKDVLSTFFWILTMGAYATYARRGEWWRYGLALLLFALGLMSKPMLVTLPCVLLLLDFWPLKRARLELSAPRPHPGKAPRQNPAGAAEMSVPRLLWEKAPFFLVAAASCIATYLAQSTGEAVVTVAAVSLSQRLANALVSYIRYIGKIFWPENLSVFYPYVREWPAVNVAGAFILLAAVTLLVWFVRKKHPYLLVGWLWYLGTMTPVIGLVQVGAQSMADRYTYVPLIGVFVMIAWGAAELVETSRSRRIALSLAGATALLACAALSFHQVLLWKDTVTLFQHALAVTPENATTHLQLGYGLLAKGRKEEALAQFQAALKKVPWDYYVYGKIGDILASQSKLDEAMTNYQKGLELKPENCELNNNMGLIWERKGNMEQAARYYTSAIQSKPDHVKAHLNLGNTLLTLGKTEEAISHYQDAVRFSPKFAPSHWSLGEGLLRQGKLEEAVAQFREALRLQPDWAEAHGSLGLALAQQGKADEALTELNEAIRLKPGIGEFHFRLAMTLQSRNKLQEAIDHYEAGLRLAPDSPAALNNLAWLLATQDDARIRNGQQAVRHAERACELTARQQPLFLGTLAAAYAEAGRYAEAVSTAQKAMEVANAAGQKEIVATNQKLLEIYKGGRPYHEARKL